MKKILIFILVLLLTISGCTIDNKPVEKKRYSATFLVLFDTVTQIIGFAESKSDFEIKAKEIHDKLEETCKVTGQSK